jgi:hypothetical protein
VVVVVVYGWHRLNSVDVVELVKPQQVWLLVLVLVQVLVPEWEVVFRPR